MAGDVPVSFFVPGAPVGWQRNGYAAGVIYKQSKTRKWQMACATLGAIAMGGAAPLLGPLEVVIVAKVPIPRSWPATKSNAAIAGAVRPTGKPDYDNVSKIVGDALNGIVWKDDAQIVRGITEKTYSVEPGVLVTVRML